MWLRLPVFGIGLLLLLILLQSVMHLFSKAVPEGLRPSFWMMAEITVGLIMLAAYRFGVSRYEQRKVAELSGNRCGARITLGIALGALMFTSVLLMLWAVGVAGDIEYQGIAHVWAELGSAIAAAIGEELVFRGILFRVVEERAGTSIAVISSAILFGLLHAANPGATWVSTLAIVLEAGVLLGLSFAATRNLWFPIGLHFGWNFAEGGLFGTSVSGVLTNGVFSAKLAGSTLLTGGAFGPEASIVSVGVSLIVSAAMMIVIVRRGRWRDFRTR